MIRFLGINAFIGVYTIILCLFGLLLSLFNRQGRVIHFYVAVPWAKGIAWVCGVELRVKGLENVDGSVPRVYLSNHQSYFDIIALLAGLPIDFKYVLKKELMEIPLFGSTVRRAGYIAVDRTNPRKALESVKQAAERIRNGTSVVMFPEGTRSEDGRVQPFMKGGFHLALESGCDIVPVAICNSRHIAAKGSLRVNRGTVTLVIGKPIPVKGCSKRDINGLMARVRETIINLSLPEQGSKAVAGDHNGV